MWRIHYPTLKKQRYLRHVVVKLQQTSSSQRLCPSLLCLVNWKSGSFSCNVSSISATEAVSPCLWIGITSDVDSIAPSSLLGLPVCPRQIALLPWFHFSCHHPHRIICHKLSDIWLITLSLVTKQTNLNKTCTISTHRDTQHALKKTHCRITQ